MMWIVYVAFGKSEIVDAATADPVGLVFSAMEVYVGHSAVVVMEVLLVTSAFASTLAFHNTASRYMFTLSREKMLPSFLSRVHPKHHSPFAASGFQSALGLVIVLVFAIIGADPNLQLFLLLVAPGVLTVIVLQAITSLAIILYFNRDGNRQGLSIWSTVVAPVLSLVGLGVATYLIVINFDLLSGRTDWVNWLLLSIIPLMFAVGVARALWMRSNAPDDYAKLTETNVF